MDRIKIAKHQLRTSNKLHPMIFVNDRSLSEFLSEIFDDECISGLGPALIWLWEEDEIAVTIARIKQEVVGCSTTVPLLISGDDCDLTSIVLMVDVEITENSVKWNRFGYDQTKSIKPNEIGTTIRWLVPKLSFEFDKKGYFKVRDELVSLANV